MYHTQSINLKQNLRRIGRLAAPFMAAAMLALLLPGLVLAATFITTVDTGANALGDAGQAGSVALNSSGLAVISYWDKTAGNVGDLKVAFCNDPACSNPTIQSIDDMEDARTTSVALTGSDVPVISYPGLNGVQVAFCNSATDCSSPITRTIDSGVTALYSSLALNSSGFPVVSYSEGLVVPGQTFARLKVAFCQDAACNSVTTRVVDGDGTTTTTGDYNSLALTGGDVPVISYAEQSGAIGGRLMLATCESATDCSSPTINIVDNSNPVSALPSLLGRYSSLALNSSGFPVISYYEERGFDLKLAVCSDAVCGSSVFSTTVDTAGDVGQYSSLALNNSGFPVISYVDVTNTALKLATCNDATCSSSPTLQTLDNTGAVGQYASLALNSTDGPAVSYYDVSNKDLKLYTNTTGCNTSSWTANNEASLNAAITCYNTKTVASSYTITVTDDIDLTASTTIINNATSGVSLVIEGDGFAVDGQDAVGVRPFEIAADTTVTMNHLTVTGGNIPSDQGGGIYNGGTLTISSSTISDNSAFSAGGIENRGTLTVFNSTISGNSTSGSPGGGGIVNGFGGVLTLDSVTISANSDTSATGTGGLWTSNTAATLRNSILAGNSGRDCGSTSGTPVTDGGHNLVGTQSNCGLTNGANGTIVGSDPLLGPLADNGGDTETHALLGGSPAIDAGSTSLTTDQRGVTRPQFGVADIGAYESVCGTATSWTAATEFELDTAIGCFNKQTVAGSYTITATGDFTVTGGPPAIDNPNSGPSLVIEGDNHTIDGEGRQGFAIQSATAVTMNNLTLTDWRNLLGGGAIRHDNVGSHLLLNNMNLTHNTSGFGAGALFSRGVVTITNSTFFSNTNNSVRGGGAIDILGPGKLTLIDSELTDNASAGNGGALLAESNPTIIIEGSFIDGNTAADSGGGIYQLDGTMTISDSTISNNTAVVDGGGILNSGGNLTLNNATVAENTADTGGGGIYNGATLTINQSTVADNTVTDAAASGGGITNVGTLTMQNSTVSGNTAVNGGGISSLSANLTLDSVTIAANTASSSGAGLFYLFTAPTMANTILAGNNGAEDCAIGPGTPGVTDNGHNLIGTQAGCGFVDGANGTLVGQDPLLGPLADNGGETETHALLGGSPAIDAGSTSLTTDQRGVTRPQFGVADIGAYESVCGTATSWTAATEFELDTAIGCFNKQTVAASYTITVTGNISLTSSIAAIDNPTSGPSLVIVGGNHIIDGGDAPGNPGAGGFVINSPTAVSITDLTVTRSRQLLTGGAIRNPNGGALTLNNVSLTHNAAGFGGGALSSTGPVTITNSLISNNANTAARGGGGILIESPGSLTLIDSEVSDNTTAVIGGGIYAESGANLTITRSTISGNSATRGGGGLANFGSLSVGASTLSDNSATGELGGGIYNADTGSLILTNSTLSGNNADLGGGIYNDGALDLDSVTIANNTVTIAGSINGGGALYAGGDVTMNNSILAGSTGSEDCFFDGLGSFVSGENNLIETQTTGDCGIGGDIVNTDPKLGPLADNGGETETHALLGGSPAIDAGSTSLTTDQRGVTRPQGAADDMGAFEAEIGTLTIIKDADPADDTPFDFTITGGISDTFTLRDPSAISTTFSALVGGNYQVTELLPAGWQLDYVDCQHGPNSTVGINYGENRAYIGLAPGDDVTCTFTNTNTGTITLVKDAEPADDTIFRISVGDPNKQLTSYNVQDPTNPSVTFSGIIGLYQVREVPQSGWAFPVSTCRSSLGTSTFSAKRFGVDINLASGDDVTCTIRNEKQGSLKVVKNAVGGDAAFAFTSTALGNFTLATSGGTAEQNFANLTPGTYDLAESALAGWKLDGATCSDGSTLPNISVDPGEDVTCTFTNSKLDTIVVKKRAEGGDATFAFSSPQLGDFNLSTVKGKAQQAFSNLTPGTYAISESALAGWTATAADPVCSNGDNAGAVTLAAGETVVCEFVNQKQDTLIVEKRTIGGDGSFAFSSPQLGDFNLSTVKGAASQSFTGLQAGTFSISETVPAGWVQSGAACSNGADPSNINLTPGLTVSCVFTNTKLSSITVVKRTLGGDASFAFTGDLGSFGLSTVAGTAQQTFANLAAGTYAVSETALTGWAANGASCSDGSSPSAIDLAPGEDVTCTFDNTKLGSLTVVKNASGGDASFDFTSTNAAIGSFSLSTSNGTASQTFTDLVPGIYDLSESPLSGWRQNGITCSDGSQPGSIAIDPGEDVTCTFENTKLDTITVIKRTVGGDGSFDFTSTLPGGSSFSLSTTGNVAQRIFDSVPPASYAITESVPSGWRLQTADPICSNGDPASALTLAAGESITCEFVNLKMDTLIVEKQSIGGDGVFDFTSDLPGGAAFSLTTTNGISRTSFSNLPAGTYSISETVPAGWDLTAASCDNGDAPGAVTLAAGETVTCRFENTQRGRIEVLKRSIGGDDTFSFTGDLGSFDIKTASGLAKRDFFDVLPGTYAITETVPAGWDLTSAVCTDGSDPSAITLSAGEQVTCIFTNSKLAGLTVRKQTTNGDGVFDFNSVQLGAFVLTTTNGTAQQRFDNQLPGIYDITEGAATDWSLVGATCDNGDSPANLTLNPGDDVTCTFENGQNAQGAQGPTVLYLPQIFKQLPQVLYLPRLFKQLSQVVYSNDFGQGADAP